jgi:hypothetical protein
MSSTPRLRSAPDFRRLLGDVARHKDLARNAYQAARAAGPIPTSLVDRLWVRTLQAAEIAPPPVALRMYRRSETLYRLLLDHQRWPTEPQADPQRNGP